MRVKKLAMCVGRGGGGNGSGVGAGRALVKPPDGKSLQATMSTVQDVYGDEIKALARRRKEKVCCWPRRSLKRGSRRRIPDSKFALLTLGSWDLATESGSLVIAGKAIDALAAAYSIDGLKMRAAAAAAAAAAKPRAAESGRSVQSAGGPGSPRRRWPSLAGTWPTKWRRRGRRLPWVRAAGDASLQARGDGARAAAVKDAALTVASVAKLALDHADGKAR